jgi:hypothetical protein
MFAVAVGWKMWTTAKGSGSCSGGSVTLRKPTGADAHLVHVSFNEVVFIVPAVSTCARHWVRRRHSPAATTWNKNRTNKISSCSLSRLASRPRVS